MATKGQCDVHLWFETMRPLIFIFMVLFGATAAFYPAAAERRVALVIGNSAYKHTSPLDNPKNDAKALSAALGRLGFKVLSGLDTDIHEMIGLVRKFAKEAEDADVALFYYAGHGLQVDGQNYLAPVDAELNDLSDLDFGTIKLSSVLRQMSGARKANLVFLDACRDNPLMKDLARSLKSGRSASFGRGLARVEAGIGTLVSYATQPGNIALDGNDGHSPFTKALLTHIETPGIDVSTMMIKVRQDVIKSTSNHQIPWDHSSLTDRFFFQTAASKETVAAKVATGSRSSEQSSGTKAQERIGGSDAGTAEGVDPNDEGAMELAFWESVRDTDDADLLQAYLDRYPDGTFANLAKVMIGRMRYADDTAEDPTEEETPTAGPEVVEQTVPEKPEAPEVAQEKTPEAPEVAQEETPAEEEQVAAVEPPAPVEDLVPQNDSGSTTEAETSESGDATAEDDDFAEIIIPAPDEEDRVGDIDVDEPVVNTLKDTTVTTPSVNRQPVSNSAGAPKKAKRKTITAKPKAKPVRKKKPQPVTTASDPAPAGNQTVTAAPNPAKQESKRVVANPAPASEQAESLPPNPAKKKKRPQRVAAVANPAPAQTEQSASSKLDRLHQQADKGNRAAALRLARHYDDNAFPDAEAAAQYASVALRDGGRGYARHFLPGSRAWSRQFWTALQRQLKAGGVYNGRIDGLPGNGTHRAVKVYSGLPEAVLPPKKKRRKAKQPSAAAHQEGAETSARRKASAEAKGEAIRQRSAAGRQPAT